MKEEMMNRITDAVRKEFGHGCEVQLHNVTKNNGLVLNSVIIREPGTTVAPIVYIDEILDQLVSGRIDVQKAAQTVVDIYREHRNKEDIGRIITHFNKRDILDNVSCQLINAEKNEFRISNMPHREFLDLAVVYRVTVGENETGTSSFLVTSEILKRYGLDEEELYSAALENMERQGFLVTPIESILAESIGVAEGEAESGCNMWVLTNTKKFNGAAVMLFPDCFEKLADKIGSDLYVLPSSIHEVIAVPVNVANPAELKAMVCDVNSSVVSVDEYLGGNVYKYIRREDRLVIA